MAARYAVILAGGKGERFWPLSTSRQPKQLLSLVGDKPLLAQAVDRVTDLMPLQNIYIVTNQDLVEPCKKAVPNLPPENIIGEPVGRDTAAAVALSAALVKAKDPNAVFCILTADHVIGDLPLFQKTLSEAMTLAEEKNVLITIGIKPTEPSTGYGYIESGSEVKKAGEINFLQAKRFVEKPNHEKATEYLKSGRFFWNSGMFIWSVKSVQESFQKHRPVLAKLIDTMARVAWTKDFYPTLEKEYGVLEKISVDYALMEKSDNIVMAVGLFKWDDVGSWTALENHFPKDGQGNLKIGTCEQVDASNNIVFSKKNHLTTLVGVDNVIVVQAEGVTLVCSRDKAQDIKKLVEQLKKSGRYNEVL